MNQSFQTLKILKYAYFCTVLPFCGKVPNNITHHDFFSGLLIHCGLVMPYGIIELGQHWLRNCLLPGNIKTLPELFSVLLNKLRPRQNGHHFPDDILKCIFLNKNVWNLINISLIFFPKVPINLIPALAQIMAWHQPGDKPLSGPMMVNLLMHLCVTQPQWVNQWKSNPRIAPVPTNNRANNMYESTKNYDIESWSAWDDKAPYLPQNTWNFLAQWHISLLSDRFSLLTSGLFKEKKCHNQLVDLIQHWVKEIPYWVITLGAV